MVAEEYLFERTYLSEIWEEKVPELKEMMKLYLTY